MIKINQRQSEIFQLIKEKKHMDVSDILPLFSVSPPTIRKDLTLLEDLGMIVRTHGSVHLAEQQNPQLIPFDTRSCLNQKEKEIIAKIAAQQIHEGDSIILDSGTTMIELAKLLVDRENLTIFTSSLPIAMLFVNSSVSVNLLGGIFVGNNMSVQGPEAEAYIRRIEVDKTFISSSGVRPSYGLTNAQSLEASLERCMIEAGKTVYALLDSSKFSLSSVYPFASFSDLDYLITEKPIENSAIVAELEAANVEVLIP